MNEINIKKLVEWLEPEGASAGLEGSNITVSALYEKATISLFIIFDYFDDVQHTVEAGEFVTVVFYIDINDKT